VHYPQTSIRLGFKIHALDSAERGNHLTTNGADEVSLILPAPATLNGTCERRSARDRCACAMICTHPSRFLIGAEQQANQSDYSKVQLAKAPACNSDEPETSSFT
jgi:hypothetical protein